MDKGRTVVEITYESTVGFVNSVLVEIAVIDAAVIMLVGGGVAPSLLLPADRAGEVGISRSSTSRPPVSQATRL